MKKVVLLIFSLSCSVFAQDKMTDSSPAPGVALDDSWSFNPLTVKRDPFLSPKILVSAPIREIFRYDISNFKLVGIVSGIKANKALFVVPSGKSYVLQKGDILGRRKGTIAKITNSEVTVRAIFIDNQNKKQPIITKFTVEK